MSDSDPFSPFLDADSLRPIYQDLAERVAELLPDPSRSLGPMLGSAVADALAGRKLTNDQESRVLAVLEEPRTGDGR